MVGASSLGEHDRMGKLAVVGRRRPRKKRGECCTPIKFRRTRFAGQALNFLRRSSRVHQAEGLKLQGLPALPPLDGAVAGSLRGIGHARIRKEADRHQSSSQQMKRGAPRSAVGAAGASTAKWWSG
jgi:hypothetical protein